MSDEVDASTESRDAPAGGERSESRRESAVGPNVDVETAVTYLLWGVLVGLGVLAVVATVGLYASLSSIIDVWVASRYQPFARTGLNLAVLCAAGSGIVLVVRQLRRR